MDKFIITLFVIILSNVVLMDQINKARWSIIKYNAYSVCMLTDHNSCDQFLE